jgi:hypothetical protein
LTITGYCDIKEDMRIRRKRAGMISRIGLLQPTISIVENSKNQQVMPLFSAVLFISENRKKSGFLRGKRFRPLIICGKNSKNSETAMPRMALVYRGNASEP